MDINLHLHKIKDSYINFIVQSGGWFFRAYKKNWTDPTTFMNPSSGLAALVLAKALSDKNSAVAGIRHMIDPGITRMTADIILCWLKPSGLYSRTAYISHSHSQLAHD